MSSFGILVTVVGVTVGTVSILITVTILYSDRRTRKAKLDRVERVRPRPGLEAGDRGNIELRQLDESIGSFTVHDYAASAEVAEWVDSYLRPLRDLRRLRDLLEAEGEQRQEQRTNSPYRSGLRNADLSGADLRGVNLRNVDLRGTNLRNTDLRNTDLRNTDLSDADLRGVEGLTQEQIKEAIGDATTKLPEDLEQPKSWTQDENKQNDEDA